MIRSRSPTIESIRSSSIRLINKQEYQLKLQEAKDTEKLRIYPQNDWSPKRTVTNYSLKIQKQTST